MDLLPVFIAGWVGFGIGMWTTVVIRDKFRGAEDIYMLVFLVLFGPLALLWLAYP